MKSSGLDNEVALLLINVLSDSFNRTINALSNNGVIDTKKLHSEYKGVGSKYYDMVTTELEYTANQAAPEILKSIRDILEK